MKERRSSYLCSCNFHWKVLTSDDAYQNERFVILREEDTTYIAPSLSVRVSSRSVVDAWHPHESKMELGGKRLFSVFVNRFHRLAVILYETLVSFFTICIYLGILASYRIYYVTRSPSSKYKQCHVTNYIVRYAKRKLFNVQSEPQFKRFLWVSSSTTLQLLAVNGCHYMTLTHSHKSERRESSLFRDAVIHSYPDDRPCLGLSTNSNGENEFRCRLSDWKSNTAHTTKYTPRKQFTVLLSVLCQILKSDVSLYRKYKTENVYITV